MTNKARGLHRVLSAVVLAGVLGFSPNAYSAEVTQITMEVEETLGVPAVQAEIVACIGEPVFFTGTVRITLVDGVVTHSRWGPMTGTTADGDQFIAASGFTLGRQSNLTLVEVGAGKDNRQFRLQIVQGEATVTCH